MPRCLKCGSELNWLRLWSGNWSSYQFFLNEAGQCESFLEDEFWDEDKDEFQCPECQEVLFQDEEKAIAFLRGI